MNYKELFDDEFIEKVYLYAYKKLHDKSDAMDLAQDIFAEALTAIHKGKKIISFYSWFWALAHNRYCVFLSKKNKTPYTLSIEGGQVADTLESDFIIDDPVLIREEISELNYAISRLSKEHREMIIMYYLKEMKISEIAAALSIPEGTVKRRLFDTKNNLKKGIENMNNTGKLAYAPVYFYKWGGYNLPQHWKKISDLMLEQIFVVCRNEAKTINEIAEEIAVAPVYLEKIIEYPLLHNFLKRDSGGRILTDFCVLPHQAIYNAEYQASIIYSTAGAEITEVLEKKKDSLLEFDFYGNKFDYNYLLWIFYVYACERFALLALQKNRKLWGEKINPFLEKGILGNGKDYRIAGGFVMSHEKTHGLKPIKQVNWSNLHENFENSNYGKITYVNFFQSEPFSDRDGLINASNHAVLFKIIESDGSAELNQLEREQTANFISKGIVVKEGGKLKVNIPVMTYECESKMQQWLNDLIDPLADKYVNDITAMAGDIIYPLIREDLLEEYVNWILAGYLSPLPFVLYWAMYEGNTLAIPDDYSKSAAALYLKTR